MQLLCWLAAENQLTGSAPVTCLTSFALHASAPGSHALLALVTHPHPNPPPQPLALRNCRCELLLRLQGSTLYIANVGDSRAVLAETKGGRLVARDLTWDQTPFRCASWVGEGEAGGLTTASACPPTYAPTTHPRAALLRCIGRASCDWCPAAGLARTLGGEGLLGRARGAKENLAGRGPKWREGPGAGGSGRLGPGALSALVVSTATRLSACREDELDRVTKAGARVLTLDQLEGIKVRGAGAGKLGGLLLCAWLRQPPGHALQHGTQPFEEPSRRPQLCSCAAAQPGAALA